jgi:hypothetical protein
MAQFISKGDLLNQINNDHDDLCFYQVKGGLAVTGYHDYSDLEIYAKRYGLDIHKFRNNPDRFALKPFIDKGICTEPFTSQYIASKCSDNVLLLGSNEEVGDFVKSELSRVSLDSVDVYELSYILKRLRSLVEQSINTDYHFDDLCVQSDNPRYDFGEIYPKISLIAEWGDRQMDVIGLFIPDDMFIDESQEDI